MTCKRTKVKLHKKHHKDQTPKHHISNLASQLPKKKHHKDQTRAKAREFNQSNEN